MFLFFKWGVQSSHYVTAEFRKQTCAIICPGCYELNYFWICCEYVIKCFSTQFFPHITRELLGHVLTITGEI